ncbi:RecX family transcriptional regulator [Candidatus Saccharibacteria bacterium]|nr:RecX family transcriptional regulator [Candidatus Saccharibacteria bacterium]
MEIIKLNEPNNIFTITNLKQGVKNPNRVNVYIDETFAFSLDVAQVVDFKLKVRQKISEEDLEKYKKASEFGKLYQRTLEWVLIRPRSEKETREYLRRKFRMSSSGRSSLPSSRGSSLRPRSNCGCPSEDILEFSRTIIERLVEKGYVDDRKFAEYYVENRFVKKGISQKRLKMELMKKGIAAEIIEEVLGGRNDEEEIRKMVMKKRGKYDEEKLIAYLCRQGFSYDLVKKVVEED